MRVKIIQVGKTKEKYLEIKIEEYVKRIMPFAEIDFVTLKEVCATKTFTEERCKEDEGEQILKVVGGDDFLVVLDENGRQMGSVDFAKFVEEAKDLGRSITFVIGGPYGLSKSVKSRANLLLSLSKMTFTHQMIRLFLLEQIYRAYSILAGKSYHNQ